MKRVASIQDISCLGRCSLTVALPVLAVMGVECAVIPTAVLSTHTIFPDFTCRDLTDELLVAEPYHMLYVYWLEAKLDEQYREWDEYNNHRALFDAAWKEFAEHWTSTHMPIQYAPHYIL